MTKYGEHLTEMVWRWISARAFDPLVEDVVVIAYGRMLNDSPTLMASRHARTIKLLQRCRFKLGLQGRQGHCYQVAGKWYVRREP